MSVIEDGRRFKCRRPIMTLNCDKCDGIHCVLHRLEERKEGRKARRGRKGR